MLTNIHPLPSNSPGTQRQLHSLHFGHRGGAKAVIQASLHADEIPAMLVAHHLRQRLALLEAEDRVVGEIVLLPMANPIGLAQSVLQVAQGRFDLASGENFNRHFADLFEPVAGVLDGLALDSDPAPALRAALRDACAALPATNEMQGLRRALLGLAVDADIVLDLHCDNEAVLHLYTAETLWPAAEPLARLLGAELVLLANRSGGEPFDEACSMLWPRLAERWRQRGGRPFDAHCLAVTVELRGEADVADELASRDAQALLDFLALRGLIRHDRPAEMPALRRAPRPLAGSLPVTAPAAGVVVFQRRVGDWLQVGDPIADLVCPLRGTVTPLCSPVAGLLYAHEHRRFVLAGARVAKVAGEHPLREGPLLSAR